MKLTKIYSNKNNIFNPVTFNEGFNVVFAEIKLRENQDKDTHNLGKSRLMDLIDYCLLKERNPSFFLFKYFERFKDFIFFLELKLNNGKYLTVKRPVSSNTKISIKIHKEKEQDFTLSGDKFWDYFDIPIDTAKLILDANFNLKSISPWDYRTAINYALRNQDDFSDIFKLSNFLGRHLHWKPYVGKILGFNADNLKRNYELIYDIEKSKELLTELRLDIGEILGDEEEVLTGLLDIKNKESESLQKQLDTFNFDKVDAENINKLVSEIDEDISELNKVKYYLSANIRKHNNTLKDEKINLKTSLTQKLFEEAGIIFDGQIKKSYDDLIEFKRKITTERKKYVKVKVKELEDELNSITNKLKELNISRSQKLSYLNKIGTFDKYKEVTSMLLSIKTEINDINRKLTLSKKISETEEKISANEKEQSIIKALIKDNREEVTKDKQCIYNSIKTLFSIFVLDVLDKNAFISTKQNKEGNLEFYAGIMGDTGEQTGESDGHSYKKILCMGYDLSVSLAYSNADFVRFIYHDGGLETLDERKKKAFLNFVRTYSELFGIQYILTVIDSDMPSGVNFSDEEIVLNLHDNGQSGRLFKMPSW
ncbi:DUF2326 domain-containing protein [Vibrio vulnificus]|uniref:DUF2326 domain-containing protein n=1 Tax=Vibrio cholerae TaxID=666 RepID=UPI000B49310D|nr:DUF2326 domain-containing protein [Vibrio cholerae]EGQ7933903.1 DUF2326 domain-containing protein [Vibrio vulnificus]EGQ8223955.1 DUF2326 domain-containing protein [Vibrio cholerae]EJN6712386.1 DUF2326 domain-containing protein [Vibrio vulnificus]EKF9402012.1 DUF2326 domain-containing protein [Vibrio cholerae]ELF1651958.1 DUF2326 domain-containing protein [Vibrio cholerae]